MLLLASALLAACTIFPKARDVTVEGIVRDEQGRPLAGVEIYYAVLKFRPGMPGVGEHGYVTTDLNGRYLVKVGTLYDILSLSEIRSDFGCGPLADIPAADFSNTHVLVRDFICPQAANSSSKPTPLRGAA